MAVAAPANDVLLQQLRNRLAMNGRLDYCRMEPSAPLAFRATVNHRPDFQPRPQLWFLFLAKSLGSLDAVVHLCSRVDGQGVLGKTGSGSNVIGHFPGNGELTFRAFGQQRDDQVFQGNDPDTQVNQFGVGQRGRGGKRIFIDRCGCGLIVPCRQRWMVWCLSVRERIFIEHVRGLQGCSAVRSLVPGSRWGESSRLLISIKEGAAHKL